ncbi:MAG: helix-turn-helix domain-containing protein [Lachnospiraceae bacterium]|nr:helix-turn-helix domain-containing protein [Lachnospiraceae bacterium]
MDQNKIGRFIAECRKAKQLTQAQLAEKLNITDRAISKWETGKGMPDSSIMLGLCDILGISVNELLRGESIEMENYSKAAEENLLAMKRETEKQHRLMLNLEVLLGLVSTIAAFVILFVTIFYVRNIALITLLSVVAAVIFMVGIVACLKIEQSAGYYECAECGHRYIPKCSAVFLAVHYGRTRKMKCPKCGQRSWNKKVLTK